MPPVPIARGVSFARFEEQAKEIADLNRTHRRFRLFRGVEANITAGGDLDVDATQRRHFDIVVAPPHSGLQSTVSQTARMLAAVTTPGW